MGIDKRTIGEQNVLVILTNLHRFGWLTSNMVACLVWPDAKQSIAMARRTLKSILDEKLILRRLLPEGSACYTLSAAGARFLSNNGITDATSGASLALGNAVHRACANWFVIQHLTSDGVAWTEHEIQSGRAPVRVVDNKTPDALLETEEGLIWVEIENAWKNRKERDRVVKFCSNNLTNTDKMKELCANRYLFRMAIIATSSNSLRAICKSFAEAYKTGDISELQATEVDVALLPVDNSLGHGEIVRGNLWYDVITPSLQ